MRDKKMNNHEIVEFIKENSGWILQHCQGIGGDGWWWLRNTEDTTKVIHVNGCSANSASKKLRRLPSKEFRHSDYGI